MNNQEREAFEAWAASVGYHTERDMFQLEKYQSTLTWELWRVWQAGAAYQREQPSDDVAKDAARYQWLVKHSTYGIDYRQRPELTLPIYAPDHRDGLSAAIDAAMAGGGE